MTNATNDESIRNNYMLDRPCFKLHICKNIFEIIFQLH